ncbi:MAG: DNA topoisomerase VI subunit B, partial [Candidatus Micrarchaeaceae archaeon]
MAETKNILTGEEIFKQFKQYSISEFFRKNSQMLGYSGKVRSLTTIVHEYVTNSLDAAEEANILPEITVEIKQVGEDRYSVLVADNGPGIPQTHIGKALATILSGTKFHRYIQQRGQQGIGATGCTLYAQVTTGKPIHVKSGTGGGAYECNLSLDIKTNKPLVTDMVKLSEKYRGITVSGEFGDVKYESSDHGVYEYIKRTALSNPHATIKLIEPDGKEAIFLRSINELPKKPKQIKPHPLGIGTSDLLDAAHLSENRRLSAFLMESFSRVTQNKIDELHDFVPDIDMSMDPHSLTWPDAEKLIKAIKQVKWIAPELDSLSTIGEKQIEVAVKNILNPQFSAVVERRPKVFRGGIPFVVEACIAYGGDAGKVTEEGHKGNILRFANKVPLLFDGSGCAITTAVNSIDWKRYGISNFEEEPVSIFVNVSSVYVPYSGVGKQAIAQEDEIIEEIKLAIQDCGRALQRHISGMRSRELKETRMNALMRYVDQMSADLGDITGQDKGQIKKLL